MNKFGRNTDIDTSEEDIWDGGGRWKGVLAAAETFKLVSNDVNDDFGGTGMNTVRIYGHGSDGTEISEVVNLNGTTAVATLNSYIVIYRMFGTLWGSGGVNAGLVQAYPGSGSTADNRAIIAIGNNQTLMAIWRVPDDKLFHLKSYYASLMAASLGATKYATLSLYSQSAASAGAVGHKDWRLRHNRGMSSDASSGIDHDFKPNITFDGGTVIKLAASTSANNFDISGGFSGDVK